MSQLFTSGGQNIRASASASVFPMDIQDWFPLGMNGLNSLLSKRLSKVFSSITIWKQQFFGLSFLYAPTFTSIRNYWKNIALSSWTFLGKVMSLHLNMLSRFVIAFPPENKHLLISWLQSPSAVILEPKKVKALKCFHCFPIYFPWSDGTRCHDLSFLNVEF